ncbi:MAG: hypothetical protein ACQ9ET_02465 [Nitrosomonadaceae bacterium]
MFIASCGGGDGGISTGGGVDGFNVTGTWKGTLQSRANNVNGTITLSLEHTLTLVNGRASVTFPPSLKLCLKSSSVTGTTEESGNTVSLTLINNNTILAMNGQGSSAHLTGTYSTLDTNETQGCQSDNGTFEIRKQ